MKKTATRIIALAITCSICISSGYALTDKDPETYVKPKEKYEEPVISDYLLEKIEQVNDENTLIPVSIWTTDINQDELIMKSEKAVGVDLEKFADESALLTAEVLQLEYRISEYEAKKQGKDFDELLVEKTKVMREPEIRMFANDEDMLSGVEKFEEKKEQLDVDLKLADDFIEYKRAESIESYAAHNTKMMNILSIDEKNISLQSNFAPMTIAELSISDIKRLAEEKQVIYMDYFEDSEAKPQATLSANVTGGLYNRSTLGVERVWCKSRYGRKRPT